MKGIILAGGTGSRLFPSTLAVCKQLLAVFDKPMVYYPLSILMLAGIREILIISTPEDISRFEKLFGDGSHLGLEMQYAVQLKPEGLAQAFLIGKSFIKKDPVALILGDNIFYGHDFPSILNKCSKLEKGGIIFGYHVQDPTCYGVVEFDRHFRVTDVQEKPESPKSNYAIPGLYFYDNQVVEFAEKLKPSKRGELEITDLNRLYLQKKKLEMIPLGRGYAWLDTGTFDDLQKAAAFVQTIQERQGIKIACIEEIAYRMGFIDRDRLHLLSCRFLNNEYGRYLKKIVEDSRINVSEISQKFSKEVVFR